MSDIQNFRNAVERFDELIIDLERLDEKLSSNFSKYENANNELSSNLETQTDIVNAINTLQVRANKILENINTLNDNTRTINIKTINTIESKLKDITNSFENIIDTAIEKVDLTSIKNQIEAIVSNAIDKMPLHDLSNAVNQYEKHLETMQEHNNDLKSNNEQFKDINLNILHTIENFENISKVVNFKVILSTLLIGLFLGTGASFIYLFPFAKEQIEKRLYADEKRAIEEYQIKKSELDSKYANASELEKKSREYNIKFQSDKDGNKYIIMPNRYVEKQYISNTDWQVWKLY